MDRRKGQNLVEYALMLGLVVGLGFGFYTGGAGGQTGESIRSVFSHADTLLSEAADRGRFSPLSPVEVVHKLREGRFSRLSKELMRKCYNPSKPLCIPSYSEGGRKIAEDLGIRIPHGYAILVREEFSCLEFIMNRDTINWILKKLNTGGRIWSIYQRKSIKTASATRWWETTTSPIWSCRRKAAPLGGGAGCTRRFCKNTGPASTMHCFCRKNSGHILMT